MLKTIYKNVKHRNISKKYEFKINLYKIFTIFFRLGLINKKSNLKNIIKYFLNIITYFKSYASASRISSICPLTSRSRSIYRLFRFSRIKIRENTNRGYFIGVSKSSW